VSFRGREASRGAEWGLLAVMKREKGGAGGTNSSLLSILGG
jgi:hypothetical protein